MDFFYLTVPEVSLDLVQFFKAFKSEVLASMAFQLMTLNSCFVNMLEKRNLIHREHCLILYIL